MRRSTGIVTALLLATGMAFAQVPDMNLPDAPLAGGTRALDEPAAKKGTLTIEYVGYAAFTVDELRRAIEQQYTAVENYGLNAASSYDVGYFLEVFYRKRGYSQVDVKATITGPWSLRLDIKEGPLTKLGAITITGNKAYSQEELTGFLLGPLKEAFPRIKVEAQLPFVESLIGDGAGLIRRLYGAEGFLDAEVEEPLFTFSPDFATAGVELKIREGKQYQFGKITFSGNVAFTDEELLALITDETKNPFTEGRAATAVRKIEDFLKARGFFQADVTVDAQPLESPDGKVAVAFKIQQGGLFSFDGVTVKGTRDVPVDFVEKRFRSLSGKRYDPALVDKKFRELIGTGLFQTMRIDPSPIPGDQLRLDVEVEEAKMKEFGIGLGYGTFLGGIVSFTYSDLNIFRSGRPFTTKIELTQRGYNGEVVYSNPWLFDTDYAFKARLSAETITLEGYSKNELGFRPSLSRQVTDHWKLEAFVLAKYVSTYDILIEPESLVGRRQYSVASIGITQTLDYRNDPAIPTKGFIVTTSLDFAPDGVGDISFVRGVAGASLYLPVTSKTTLAFGARGGVISPLSADELPIDERFFNGGATTVRSFPELKLGPKDRAGWPLGGETFTVFNIEYMFPIVGELKGAVFGDAGNVISEAQNFGTSDMRYAVGAGLRYNLPVGPLRLDYGYNPDRKAGEPQGAFHFSIGLAF